MTPSRRPPSEPPLDLAGLDLAQSGSSAGRPAISVLGFARSGIALARFLVDAGAGVTVYDGRPAATWTSDRAASTAGASGCWPGPTSTRPKRWAAPRS